MRIRHVVGLGTASLWLGACASTPDVTLVYYLPKEQIKIQVVETIQCSTDEMKLNVLSYAVTATPFYTADPARRKEIRLVDLDGPLSDNSTTLNLTDDGRLKSINSFSTGRVRQW